MRLLISTLFSATLLLAGDPPSAPAPQIPRKAPELTIILHGRQVPIISTYHGYIIGLAFMSTTCPHCQHLAGVLAGLQTEYAPKGVQMLGVAFNPEANTDLGVFTATYAKSMFPVGMSTEPLVREFVQHPPGIAYIPMMVFIDKQGIIRGQHLGLNDSAFFGEGVEVANIRGELDKIIKDPVIHLPDAKKK